MAKADWNYFEFNPPAEGEDAFYGIQKAEWPAEVSPGGSEIALRCAHLEWAGATERPIFGYMYDGPDAFEFPIADITMSAAVRTAFQYAECVGFIIRSQVNLAGVITDPNDLNFYMIGVRLDSTTSGGGSVNVLRVANGVPTVVGSTYTYPVVDGATDYIQYEWKATNNGSTVELRGRRNGGSQLTNPGDPGWSNSGFVNDASPGVLLNPGFCGFAVMNRSSLTSFNICNFDRIRITQEILW